ncbi:MAG: hypothetical protein Tsb0020_54380 [Haliangiales bacterium]
MSGVVRVEDGIGVRLVIAGECADGERAVSVRLSPQGAFALARRLFSAASEIEAPSDPLWAGRCP